MDCKCHLALFLFLFPPLLKATVTSISPAVANQGTTINVVITLDSAAVPSIPPIEVSAEDIRIGTVSANTFNRTSQYKINAEFTFATSDAVGPLDVEVEFGTGTYTGSSLFRLYSETGPITAYVDIDSTAISPDGLSWATAFTDLQNGISAVVTAGGGQIWVAEGTYYPTTGSDRTASFEIPADTAMYGGFAGTETSESERLPDTYRTILSGEIGDASDVTDNVYHVITPNSGCIIDGFTITDGYANGDKSDGFGGAMLIYNIELTINDCTFTDNYAYEGGCIYLYNQSATPTISNCDFENNSSNRGGVFLFRNGAYATLDNCTFTLNTAAWRGGAVFIDYGAGPNFNNCTFTSNSTLGNGGAIWVDDVATQLDDTSPEFFNCQFDSNNAGLYGGAIAAYNKCEPEFTNCSFTNNTADIGGAIAVIEADVFVSSVTFSGNSATTQGNDKYTDDTSSISEF